MKFPFVIAQIQHIKNDLTRLLGKVKITDGAGNDMPAGDAVTRPLFVKLTDGTDVASFVKWGDGDPLNQEGFVIFGYRQASQTFFPIATAANSDTADNKGSCVTPVAHMYYDGAHSWQLISMDADARAGYQKISNGTISAGVGVGATDTSQQANSLPVVPGRNHPYIVHLTQQNLGAGAGFMLVDLSDTTNWKHTETGHIDLLWLQISINPSSAFQGDIDIGFLSDITDTSGTLNHIMTFHLDLASGPINIFENYAQAQIQCTTGRWFGQSTTSDTTWQTDVDLVGPDGGAAAYPSGDGDLVMKVTRTAGNVDIGITLAYMTEA